MVERQRAQHPARVENRGKVRAPVTSQIEQSKAGLCSEERSTTISFSSGSLEHVA